jgi:NADPH:quinone reductase-like Zn-dependent oxidoreductase
MKAVCWNGITDVAVEEVPDPKLINPRDAIVQVTSTAICGSDLHLYDGYIPTMKKGDILGHEFMGEVVEVGSGVKNLNVGDRVVVPFPISCGNTRTPIGIAAPTTSSSATLPTLRRTTRRRRRPPSRRRRAAGAVRPRVTSRC